MQPVSFGAARVGTMLLSMTFLPLMTWIRFKIDWHGCPIAGSTAALSGKNCKASKHLPPAAQQVAESESRIAALKVQNGSCWKLSTPERPPCIRSMKFSGNLDNAEGWSTWDVMGGGLMADLAKYEELTMHRNKSNSSAELRRFKTELADAEITADLQVTVDSFLKFADFFDGLFADWAVLDHINQAQSRVENTKDQTGESCTSEKDARRC